MPEPVRALEARGVILRAPWTLDVGPEVRPDRIASGAVLHAGCRIRGEATSIGPGCEIGREQPMTLINCQLGHRVSLAGGFAEEATFLDGVSCGSGAHLRPGTLLEEQASAAHSVGLKQTVLFPFVTLGSLINFCDCLMAGGDSRRRHSEVGSSFIHFNFTPHGDKATASLFGDVPRGVMGDQAPIFLGGQGGVAGPCRVEYGCVLAAGSVLRDDALEPNRLIRPAAAGACTNRPFLPGAYRNLRRIVRNNLVYLGNICALRRVYECARTGFMDGDPFRAACRQGALERLETIRRERINRLDQLADAMDAAIAWQEGEGGSAVRDQQHFRDGWPAWRRAVETEPGREPEASARERFLSALGESRTAGAWLDAVRALPPDARRMGVRWLQSVVDSIGTLWHG